jgi:hypothetical protein
VADPLPTTVSASFWDTTTTGIASGDLGTGLATAALKTLATYTDAGWDIVAGWRSFDPEAGHIWGLCSERNDGYP